MSVMEQPGLSPQGPAAPPAPPAPLDKPHPALQQVGFYGPVSEFNQRLQAVHDSYLGTHGAPPPPGMALNIATSKVGQQDIPKLFKPEFGNPDLARLKGSVVQAQSMNPDEHFYVRPDGIAQPDNPVRRIVQPLSPAQLQKKYPMVMGGGLPIPNLDKVFAALHYLNTPAPTQQNIQDQLAKGYLFGAAPGSINPLEAGHGHVVQEQLAVRTWKQAQIELNRQMGTNLPVTGTLNSTWVGALQNWMKSEDYFRKQALFQAKQEGFGNNVAAYKKAFLSKQKQSDRGLIGHFMAAMPLPLFGHGGFFGGIEAIPGYLAGNSGNPLNIGLHGLMRSAGLTLDVVGGTVSQAKADAAAGTTFAAYMNGLHGPSTYEEALAKAKEQLKANPTWARAFGAGFLPTKEPAWLRAVDQITNVAGDFILLRKPEFTGEKVGVGDITAAKASDHLNAMAGWAHSDLLNHGLNGVGRASARLGRTDGALQLVVRAAKLVKSGKMTVEQFQNHVAELYATGKTEIPTVTKAGEEPAPIVIEGTVLPALREEKLPTPGLPGTTWLKSKSHVRDFLDSFDAHQGPAARFSTDTATSIVRNLRTAVSHYVPRRSGYFDQNLPEQVFNFSLRHFDARIANKLESQVVRFQATNNVQGLRAVEKTIQKLYYDKNIGKVIPHDEPFKAVLSTEGPSIFHFPGGGFKEMVGALQHIEGYAQKTSYALNRIASLHARVLLSGLNPAAIAGAAIGGTVGGPAGALVGFGLLGPGFSLFWKHAVGDALRAELGGGGFLNNLDPEIKAAKAELNTLANSDKFFSRALGQFRERIVKGETRWALNRGGANVYTRSFDTGTVFNKRNYMEAAGGYLRRRLDDPALDAYLQGGKGVPPSYGTWPARQDALTQLVLHDKNYQGLWRRARGSNPDMTAENYAALIHDEYKPLEAALAKKGLTFDDAKAFYNTVRGADDTTKLGQWIAKHEVDFPVRGGLVHDVGSFDEFTGRWIANVIMAPNKWNRGRFGENILAKNYSEFRKAGWDEKTAFNAASEVSYAMTKYHMLDFANRLQVEQDLRWMSYFATKSRLYWKWVTGTFLRHPGYAAAVSDFKQVLNSQGGITIPVKVLGMEWQIPAENLVWVPGREYEETSLVGETVLNLIKSGGNLEQAIQGSIGTQGNLFTRSDTAIVLGTKLMRIATGNEKATYLYASSGLTKSVADKVNRNINEYQMEYLHQHGKYAPPEQAIKIALTHQLFEEYWRANKPLPIIPYQPTNQEDKTLAQYESLIDPRARREFLASHPGFSDNFGIYQNPAQYLYNQPYFERWTKAMDAAAAARTHIMEEVRKTGQYTPALEADRKAIAAALQKQHDQLLIEDAHHSGIDTHGMVPDGSTIPYGKWGKIVNKNPVFNPTHFLSMIFPNLPQGEDNVIGPRQYQAQNDLNQLNDPNSALHKAMTPEQLRTTRGELIQQLAAFKSYPSDALGEVQQAYQNRFVNTYWKKSDAKFNAIQAMASGSDRAAATDAYRAWRDSQDHPVKVNGVEFPSPVRMAWALLDPATRTQRLSVLAAKPFHDLANYELDLLGVKHPPNVSEAFSAFGQARVAWEEKYPGKSITRTRLLDWAKQIDKAPGYKGFYAYYVNTVTQPRIRQYEQTTLYQSMPPAIKSEFDQIGNAAKEVIQKMASGHSSYYKQEWRLAVKNNIKPWLDNPELGPLKRFLAPYGPNFLNDLVTSSTP